MSSLDCFHIALLEESALLFSCSFVWLFLVVYLIIRKCSEVRFIFPPSVIKLILVSNALIYNKLTYVILSE